MARVSAIEAVDLRGFAAGLNSEADPLLLDEGEVPFAENVVFELNGAVRSRGGYTRFDDDAVTGTYSFVDRYLNAAGADFFIMQRDNNNLYYMSGSTPSSFTTAWGVATNAYDWNRPVVTFNGYCYVTTRRTVNPYRFDGTTWVTRTYFDGVDLDPGFPLAAHTVVKNDRVYAANIRYRPSLVDHTSRLHWSEAINPEGWQAEDYIDFDPDDGGQITGLAVYGEELYVYKNNAIFALVGRSPASHSVHEMTRETGTVSPRTVKQMGGLLFHFDHQQGVYAFDGASFTNVSVKINSELLGGINKTAAHKASAYVHRDKYYLSVPWGSDDLNTRSYVFDTRSGAWTCFTYGVADAVSVNGVAYGGRPAHATESGPAGLYELHVLGSNDGAVSFRSCLRTPWLSLRGSEAKSRLRRLDLAFSADLGEDVTVATYRDFQSATPAVSKVVSTPSGGATWGTSLYGTATYGGSFDQYLTQTTGWGGGRWTYLQVEVDSPGTKPFQLNRATLLVSSLRNTHGGK